jgi:iron complex outermembrane receptor protein
MSTRLPLSAVALAVLGLCQGAYAQGAADTTLEPVSVEAPATPFRQLLGVEVTGTAIINPKARERLPLTVIERRDIERSGATTLLQVLEGLSMAHNSTDEGQMITAVGAAIAVGLRGEPNSTLVLLNGVRLPNYAQNSLSGEASSAHLRLIPLIAVERIEVLREGASTLYGSDAVAGVVNIITRTDVQGLQLNVRQGLVAQGKGNQSGLELSWGKGRFERDGYQWLVSVGRQLAKPLLGSDRPSAWAGRTTIGTDPTAGYTWPGNVWDSATGVFLTHPLYADGRCDGPHLYAGEEVGRAAGRCYFDRTSLQNVYPSESSTTAFVQGRVAVGDGHAVFVEHASNRSSFDYNAAGISTVMHLDSSTGYWHYLGLLGAGPGLTHSTDRFARTLVGLDGQVLGHRYKAVVFDANQSTLRTESRRVRFQYLEDVFTTEELNTPQDQLGEATLDKIRALHTGGERSRSLTAVQGVQAQLSGEREGSDGLYSQYALAAGWRTERLRFEPLKLDVLRSEVDSQRRVAHVLGEWAVPLNEALTLALGARSDRYSDAGAAHTAKVSARYKVSDQWMWRGALGNGFRAPGLMLTSTVNEEVVNFPASSFSAGRPVRVINQGNPDLKPEKSQHLTLGTQYTSPGWAVSVDWWALDSRNLVYMPDLHSVLVDPVLYARYVRELPAGVPNSNNALGMFVKPQNLAAREQQGIDYAFRYRRPLDKGVLRFDWTGSMNLLSRFDTGDVVVNDLGQFASETSRYTPRHKWALSTVWEPKVSESHRLTLNYLSGHRDLYVPGFSDVVASHWTLDWHTYVSPRRGLTFGVGITNITNRIPPQRMTNSRHFAAGIDTRYGDFRGRTLKLSLDARF